MRRTRQGAMQSRGARDLMRDRAIERGGRQQRAGRRGQHRFVEIRIRDQSRVTCPHAQQQVILVAEQT